MDVVLPAPAAAPWLAPALWLVARATLLLLLAAVGVALLRRAPAAGRHLCWSLALAGMLALPTLSLLAPHWRLAWVQVAAAPAPLLAPGGGGALPGWGTVLLALWAAGAALVLARYGAAVAAVRLAARGARRVSDPAWRARVAAASAELGLREPVRLLRTAGAAMPMTWGILRPVVLLPEEAEGWSEERRRVVLLHELAHVARRDCLWQALASLACAAYWFHPGVWWAARRMRIEREQACDDRVLGVGTRASDYAAHLLEVARACRPRPFTAAAAVAMARRSQLEDRVVAVLDGARARGAVPARMAALAAAAAGVVLFPLAAARPDGVVPPPPEAPGITILAAEVVTAPRASISPLAAPEPRAAAEPARRAAAPPAPRPRPVPAPAVRSARSEEERALAALLRAVRDPDAEVRRAPATPSAASQPPAAPPAAARSAPSAPLDPALRVLSVLGEDTVYVDFPAGSGPGAL